MNIKELLQFATLTDAQAHAVLKQRMISPDVMLSYLTQFDVLDILDNPTTKESKGLAKAFQFGSEFNLMNGHTLNQDALLQQLVADGLVPELLRTSLIAYANSTVYPYADATQADWNQAQAMVSVKKEATYEAGDFIVRVNNEKYALEVTIDTPYEYDDTLTVTASSRSGNTDTVFADNNTQRLTIKIPSGYTGTLLTSPVNLSGLSRHIKLFAESTYNRDFTVKVIRVLS